MRPSAATLRRLLVARECRLEFNLHTKLDFFVGISKSILRPRVATIYRLDVQGPSPSEVAVDLKRLRCFELRGPSKDECVINLGCGKYSKHPSAQVLCAGGIHAHYYLFISLLPGV